MSSVTFRSRLDGWVAILLFAGAAIQILVLAIAAPHALLVFAPVLLLIAAFVAWLYFAARHVVTEDRLLISYDQGKSCLISPRRKDHFIHLLCERGVRVA